ncbi:MAG: glycosyltransferase [Chloroflexi bacterium]|nr:glycosyltransferase [Chloroflexota bacterium]
MSGVFIREHAKAASLYNDVVVMHAYHSPGYKVRGLYEAAESMEDGIRTIRIRYRCPSASGYSPISRIIRLWSTFSYFRRFMRQGWRPDVIHAHVYSAGVPAVVLGRLYHIPVVITEHWTWFVLHKLTWERRLATKFAFNRAAMVLPVSEHLKRQIELYGTKTHFSVVPNAVDTQLFCPPAMRNKSGKKRLLLAANLSPQKGVPYLFQALGRIKEKRSDFLLDIVGEGAKGATTEEYRKLANETGLDGIVRFHGTKAKKEVAEFMRHCDFFVQPSLFETFGVVYIEAMACGKPVIASNIPGPNEFITRDVGILVPPKDVKALADAIDWMLDHHKDYSAEKIANYARERFSYEVVGRKLADIYHEVSKR